MPSEILREGGKQDLASYIEIFEKVGWSRIVRNCSVLWNWGSKRELGGCVFVLAVRCVVLCCNVLCCVVLCCVVLSCVVLVDVC